MRAPRAAAVAAVLAFGGCVGGGSSGPVAMTGDLIAAVGMFARDAVAADLYAARCEGQGVALLDPSGESLAGAFASEMIIQGFTPDQIEAALRRKEAATVAADARAYIAERGTPVDGDTAALCENARREITEGTGPGRFLVAV